MSPADRPETAGGATLAEAWFEHSPFVRELELELVSLTPDRASVRLPYSSRWTTAGDTLHGGAISTLIDTTAVLAAWSAHEPTDLSRAATVAMSVSFEAPAAGGDLVAEAEVTRRGRTLCFISVRARTGERAVAAQALVTYRIG